MATRQTPQAERRARERIARARGFPVTYMDARGRVRRNANAFFQFRTTVAGHRATERSRTFADGRRIIRTRNDQTLRNAITAAARNDQRITSANVYYLADPEDGSHPRTWWPLSRAHIWERGGYDAALAAHVVRSYGTGFGLFKATIDETEKYSGVVIEVELVIE
jgi:hypothetical protein